MGKASLSSLGRTSNLGVHQSRSPCSADWELTASQAANEEFTSGLGFPVANTTKRQEWENGKHTNHNRLSHWWRQAPKQSFLRRVMSFISHVLTQTVITVFSTRTTRDMVWSLKYHHIISNDCFPFSPFPPQNKYQNQMQSPHSHTEDSTQQLKKKKKKKKKRKSSCTIIFAKGHPAGTEK